MTGRELILYILSNGLEDKPVFENGKFIGFMTVEDAAVKMNVGCSTVYAWMHCGLLDGVHVGNEIYIPADNERPIVNKE